MLSPTNENYTHFDWMSSNTTIQFQCPILYANEEAPRDIYCGVEGSDQRLYYLTVS